MRARTALLAIAFGTSMSCGGQVSEQASATDAEPTDVAATTTTDDGVPENPIADGVIVVAGGPSSVSQGILTVLDARTGRELVEREPLLVAAINHEPERDLWFLETLDRPSQRHDLHVRTLDLAGHAWTELAVVRDVPEDDDELIILHERIAFVVPSSDPSAPSGSFTLVSIDTADPSQPHLVHTSAILPQGAVIGAFAPNAVGAPPGGSFDLVSSDSSGLSVASITLAGDAVAIGAPVHVPSSGLTDVAIGSANGFTLLADNPVNDSSAELFSVDGRSKVVRAQIAVASTGLQSPIAFDACDGIAFVGDEFGTSLRVVPLEGASAPSRFDQAGRPLGRHAYDPVSHTLFAQSPNGVTALHVDPGPPVSLRVSSAFALARDLDPYLVHAVTPASSACR